MLNAPVNIQSTKNPPEADTQAAQKQIDFSGLDELPRIYFSQSAINIVSTLLAIVFFPFFFLLEAPPASMSPFVTFVLDPFFLYVAFILLVMAFLYALKYFIDRLRTAGFKKFASVNSYSYSPKRDFKGEPGSVFDKALHLDQFSKHEDYNFDGENIVEGEWRGLPFSIFSYSYLTTIFGRGRKFTVLSITLPKEFPQIVIDSHRESLGGSVIPTSLFQQRQRLELEGNFPSYFSLYTPEKRGVDALQILAPDVMQVLINSAQRCDIEIAGNRMYFYWPARRPSKALYMQAFNVAGRVLHEARRPLGLLGSKSDVRAAKAATGKALFSVNIKNDKSDKPKRKTFKRLKKHRTVRIGTIAFLLYVIFLFATDTEGTIAAEFKDSWNQFVSNWQADVLEFVVNIVIILASFAVLWGIIVLASKYNLEKKWQALLKRISFRDK